MSHRPAAFNTFVIKMEKASSRYLSISVTNTIKQQFDFLQSFIFQELEIVIGDEHISFTTSKIGSLIDVNQSKYVLCFFMLLLFSCNKLYQNLLITRYLYFLLFQKYRSVPGGTGALRSSIMYQMLLDSGITRYIFKLTEQLTLLQKPVRGIQSLN